MSDSRYSRYKPLDCCFNPITVWHNGKPFVVPCNRCPACRLGRANDWSMRLGSEIASAKYTIWFTLTYNNYYVPKLRFFRSGDKYILTSNHDQNIRFDSVKDVLRKDDIEIISAFSFDIPKIANFFGDGCTYLSKRDIQLFLKNVRTDIKQTFGDREYSEYAIRYYVIGEYGPTTLRAHAHGLIFCESEDVKDFLVEQSLYQNWKMCDKALFDEYVKLSGDGVRNYVTEYVTSFSRLPAVYQFKETKPYRLSSKSPAIGFVEFEPKEVYENVADGIIRYDKTIDRIGKNYHIRYPRKYIDRLFPKCFEYSQKTYNGLLCAYGLLYNLVIRRGFQYKKVSDFLRKTLNPLTWYATQVCFNFCVEFGCRPDYFVWLVDRKNYLYEQDNLSNWYKWQEEKMQEGKVMDVFRSYTNVGSWLRRPNGRYRSMVFRYFCESFSLDMEDLLRQPIEKVLLSPTNERQLYRLDIQNIVDNMDKSKKIKEYAQASPTNNPLVY